jgi:glycosyltransferase involved in cell wall biosynthesis
MGQGKNQRIKELSHVYKNEGKGVLDEYLYTLIQGNIFSSFKKNNALTDRTEKLEFEKRLLTIFNAVAYDKEWTLNLELLPEVYKNIYHLIKEGTPSLLGEYSFYLQWEKNIQSCLKLRPELEPVLKLRYRSLYPLILPHETIEIEPVKGFPLIFSDPYYIDWSQIALQVKKGVFCFPNSYHFFHHLFQNSFIEVIKNHSFGFLICGEPFLFSPPDSFDTEYFTPLNLSIRNWWKGVTLQGSDLKKLSDELSLLFLDGEAFFEEYSVYLAKRWHLGGDDLQRVLRKKLTVKKTRRKSVVHIVSRLCDRFAVSKRVSEILKSYQKERAILITTERQTYISHMRPYQIGTEKTSRKLAPHICKDLADNGVEVIIGDHTLNFINSAQHVVASLEKHKADIVIFHDLSVVNYLIAKLCKKTIRIYMEHGDVPEVQGLFDAVILSHDNEVPIYKELSSKLGIPFFANPNVLDVEKYWIGDPMKKSDLGLPEDSVLLVTVSHTIENRFTSQMHDAILEILKRCSNAYYIMVGPQTGMLKVHHERIILLGRIDSVPNILRTMDIYLNEFPIGGGLAILEAMAAGCPIVTMYDTAGNVRARHGGNYFGVERALSSCSVDEYVDLACSLIKDEVLRSSWSKHARKAYQKRSKIEEYFQRHQNIINSIGACYE